MSSSQQTNQQNNKQKDDKEESINNADSNADRKIESQHKEQIQPLKLDAQEFYDIHEDDLVDFETSEEFLLHFSRIGQVQLVKKLLNLRNANEIALNIDCKGTVKANFGWSPLHLAAYFGHYEVVEILLKNGADVNIQNEEGDTPLHKAAYTGRENIVILLLAHHANVFISNGDSLRPFELSKTDSIQKLLTAAEKFDIKRREERYLSAARSGQITIIKELLEDTKNCININCTDPSGNTALHCAAYRGQTEVVIFLLKNGIDTTIKNKRGQLASNVAATISLKQLIQEAHLSVMTPKVVASLKNKSVVRFEGCLLRKGRFFGWRPIWAILERGVFSYFQNRADSVTGVRRKGYKYLENAITEVVHDNVGNNNNNNPSTSCSLSNNIVEHKYHQPSSQTLCFVIIFGDRSRAIFALPKNQSELDLQKWINAINDHIYFSTNFIKQGTHMGDDSDDEEEATKQLLSPIAIQDMIVTANAHQKILERHINALQQLLNDDTLFFSAEINRDDQLANDSYHSLQSSDSISRSTIPSIKFHLNLILESSKNANSSLTQCLVLISHQNQSRQTLIQQEQEKVRALEEALQLLAREHHDLERSVTRSIHNSDVKQQQHSTAASLSIHVDANNSILASDKSAHNSNQSLNQSLVRSFACLSQTSMATDMDEFFDAFDDAFDDEDYQHQQNHHSNLNLDQIDLCESLINNNSNNSNQIIKMHNNDDNNNDNENGSLNRLKTLTTFHTANENNEQPDDLTINDSISTLSPDGDLDKTIGSDDLPSNSLSKIMEKSSLILHTLNNNTKNTSEMDVNNVEPIDSTLFSMYNNDNNYHHDDDNLVKFTANSKHRDRLPAPMVPRDEVGLWSILKHCIGKELSKITFPVIFNEPLSFLQRMTELFHYTHYLNIADQCDDIVERMENICAYIVSAYSSNWLRLNKPFNPLLGETFEYEIESSQTKIVCEQVSHHPPISAWHAESPHFILRGTSAPKLRFWGKSIEVKPEGTATLELKSRGEIYTWKSVNCCVHNIIVGKIWFEQYGTVEVTNHMNQFKLFINFKPAGWFGYDLNRLDGYIHDSEKEKLRFVYGKWNDYLKSASIEDYEEYLKANNNKFRAPDKPTDIGDKGGEHLNNHHSSNRSKMLSKLNSFTKQLTGSLDLGAGGNNDNQQQINDSSDLPPEPIESDIPKSDSSHSLDINNSRILWKAEPRPEHSSQYYNFNWFTFGLNELPEDDNERQELLKRLPPTDSRLRPDIRKLEEGDLDVAAAEKNRLEEKQREARRLRKKGKIKEFQPLWFRPELNQYTGQEDWMFTNEYWTKRDWSRCPDIF